MSGSSTAINDPFLLATYAYNQRTSKKKPKKAAPTPKHVYASHAQVAGKSEGFVTIAAQGDGVHVLDVANLRPVISHSLGPTTTFSCPAISLVSGEGSSKTCHTFVVIESSSDISEDENGRVIWMWRDPLSPGLTDPSNQKPRSFVADSRIITLHTCSSLPSSVIAVGSNGSLTALDLDLNVKHKTTASETVVQCLKSYLFSQDIATFVPSAVRSGNAAVVVLVVKAAAGIEVEVLFVDGGSTTNLGRKHIAKAAIHVTCSESGYLTTLTQDGSWQSHQIELQPSGNAFSISPTAEPVQLSNLEFVGSSQNDIVTTLALRSSFVLLGSISRGSSPEIILLLWDLRYSVVLASQTLPIPSALGHSKDSPISLSLSCASPSQVSLVLSPSEGSKASGSLSSVFVIPLHAPSHSTIAQAMGKASVGSQWIASPEKTAVDDPVRSKLLTTMETAMEKNRPKDANTAFFAWLKKEQEAHAGAQPSAKGKERSVNGPDLDPAFVKEVLLTMLQPSKPANAPYSPDIVRHLIEQGKVNSTMFDGGLLKLLRFREDWSSISLSFSKTTDLSESEIIESLKVVITHERQSSAENSMQVDSTSTIPTLPIFLGSCVCYTTTPAPLRAALKAHLQDPEDIMCILGIFEKWLDQWTKSPVKLIPKKKEVSKNKQGVHVVETETAKEVKDLPPLDKILMFLQTLIDASFFTLLQHPPAQKIIRNLTSHIEPEISFSEQIERLRGSLEPFAKAQKKALRDPAEAKAKEMQKDWRQRKKEAHQQAGMGIGLYKLEELVL